MLVTSSTASAAGDFFRDENAKVYTGPITKQYLLAARDEAVSKLADDLQQKNKASIDRFRQRMWALWRGKKTDLPLWNIARHRTLEGWVQGLDLLEEYFDYSFDFSKPPSTRAMALPANISQDAAVYGKDKEKVGLYNEAAVKHIGHAALHRFNRSLQSANTDWQIWFLMEVNRSFFLTSQAKSKEEGIAMVLDIIQNTAKTASVKNKLTALVNKLKTCPYRSVRRELSRSKDLCSNINKGGNEQ